jgi:hypothetical protein
MAYEENLLVLHVDGAYWDSIEELNTMIIRTRNNFKRIGKKSKDTLRIKFDIQI